VTTETISGPDLQEGIPVRELADGGMIAGRVGEESVVLARRGDDFFAVDARSARITTRRSR
jgi:apoptosis-inducing factor 3